MSRGSRDSSSTRRYRKVAPDSRVDESLFGCPEPISSQLDKGGNSASKAPKNGPQTNRGKTVLIVTKDLIRTLRIKGEDRSEESTILTPAEYEQMTSESQVLTKVERKALRDNQRKKDEEMKAAEERERQILEADQARGNLVLTDEEIEARDNAQRLVERVHALRMEEEDEIKRLNKLILDAQCQATLDAQIHEKKQIQRIFAEEEKRLDDMMEVERLRALEMMEQIDEQHTQQKMRGMQEICGQIQNNLEKKQLHEEIKEQEKQHIRKKQEKMDLEDLKALEKKLEEQQLLQEHFARINAETMRVKEQRREEEKLADTQNMEYMRHKMEQEAEYEAEKRRIKKEKELEIARLRAKQEKAKDYQAEQNELRARRNQEAKDREWRRKQKELGVKKAQESAALRAARTEHVHFKERLLSVEAGQEKAEFDRILKVQQEAIVKQKKEEEQQRKKTLRNAEAIRSQMREHALSAAAKRREVFSEADRLVEEARQRRAHLDEIREKKLKEMKAMGLSEKYCTEVERKARTCTL